MAKPGSEQARAMGHGIDLSAMKEMQRPLTDEEAADAQQRMELQRHWRCAGCGERIRGMGFRVTKLQPVRGPDGRPACGVAVAGACNGEDGCDFAQSARVGATLIEIVEFVWADELMPRPAAEDVGEPA